MKNDLLTIANILGWTANDIQLDEQLDYYKNLLKNDSFHTTINDQSITYTKNNDNWHTKTFDGSTVEFLNSAKSPEQKRLYQQLIILMKEATSC